MMDPRRLPVLTDQAVRLLGIGPDRASKALAALLPSVVGGFKKELLADPAGSDGLIDTLITICGKDVLCGRLGDTHRVVAKGGLLLAQIFGFREMSRIIIEKVGQASGLDRRLLRGMLPIVAILVARQLVHAHFASSPVCARTSFFDIFAGVLAGARRRRSPASILRAMLEIDSPGNPLDDVIRSASDCESFQDRVQWPR